MGLPGLKVIYLLFFFFRIWRPEYLFIYLPGDVGQDIYFQLYPGSNYGEIFICKTNWHLPPPPKYMFIDQFHVTAAIMIQRSIGVKKRKQDDIAFVNTVTQFIHRGSYAHIVTVVRKFS